jgi:serine/threonine protein phosphatase PrpC
MNFDIAALSICNPNKTKCGDAYQIFDDTEEKLLILVLADGVGSCVCDWKASEMTCQKFVQYFTENKNENNIPKRIIQAVEETDKAVLNEEGFCAGMKATFVGVVWDYAQGIIYHIGIGDSRIYSIEKETIRQISKDETATIIRKGKDGKPLIVSGMTVVSEGVTNVIGALVSVVVMQFEVENADGTSRNIREGVLLASDGFYNCKSSFEDQVERKKTSNSAYGKNHSILGLKSA